MPGFWGSPQIRGKRIPSFDHCGLSQCTSQNNLAKRLSGYRKDDQYFYGLHQDTRKPSITFVIILFREFSIQQKPVSKNLHFPQLAQTASYINGN